MLGGGPPSVEAMSYIMGRGGEGGVGREGWCGQRESDISGGGDQSLIYRTLTGMRHTIQKQLDEK